MSPRGGFSAQHLCGNRETNCPHLPEMLSATAAGGHPGRQDFRAAGGNLLLQPSPPPQSANVILRCWALLPKNITRRCFSENEGIPWGARVGQWVKHQPSAQVMIPDSLGNSSPSCSCSAWCLLVPLLPTLFLLAHSLSLRYNLKKKKKEEGDGEGRKEAVQGWGYALTWKDSIS